jgi:hypothetical protein
MGRYDQATGLCRTCRHLGSRITRYEIQKPTPEHYCMLYATWKAPQAEQCDKYEREPGSD